MCCLFGLIDYSGVFTAKERNRIITVLSRECEVRGTDATGVAFNTDSGLHIFKRPVAAHKMWYRIPDSAKVIMGHTRMTTQGSEKLNYNNHPFPGHVDRLDFALAHNGVLYNDTALRISEELPETKIQTDSYVAVQLIEKENVLSFDSIRKMAEKTRGTFCYTILDSKNNIYLVKGENPLALYKSNGYYLYASTDEILKKALKKLKLTNYGKVNISCGDILKIDASGTLEMQRFDISDNGKDIYNCHMPFYSDDLLINELTEYAGYFGISPEDIELLMYYGYEELEIEEMLYDPLEMQKCISEIRLCEMMC